MIGKHIANHQVPRIYCTPIWRIGASVFGGMDFAEQ